MRRRLRDLFSSLEAQLDDLASHMEDFAERLDSGLERASERLDDAINAHEAETLARIDALDDDPSDAMSGDISGDTELSATQANSPAPTP